MEIQTFTLENKSKASVSFCNIGAGITSVIVPDREGNMADVVLGYKNLKDYIGDGPCMGKTPGRYANRIAKGILKIQDKEYRLPVNNGENHLHGGDKGFANQLWKGEQSANRVTFKYFSKDGEAGYPGNLTAQVVYSWSEDNELTIELTAVSDALTVCNLTNHSYFNLKGENAGNILDHKLKLYASKYLPTDSGLIPTGDLADVKGTPMDFTDWKLIGEDINKRFDALTFGKGYDNCWVIDNNVTFDSSNTKCQKSYIVSPAAELSCDKSGRKLTVYTDSCGIQVYTGNWLNGCPESKSGRSYQDYDGVALECQSFPDSPNRTNFPDVLLSAGKQYKNIIKFKFSNI